jgi:trk system potassium uptake protein TrkH
MKPFMFFPVGWDGMLYNKEFLIKYMEFKSILSYLGTLLEILGILSLVPIVVAWIFNEPGLYTPFLLTAIISFILGIVLDRRFQKRELHLGSAMVLSALAFIIISLLGSIPFMFFMTPDNAVFESVSGFTTTGLTTVNPELIPHALVFWRSFSQWVGGVGILFIFLLLIRSPGISSYYIYKAEGKTQKIEAGIQHTVKRVAKIYGGFTIIGIVLLGLAGMPLFDSVNHTFTALSTGGFSTRADSIAGFGSPWISLVIVFLMVLGATSFFVHDRIIRRRFREYLNNPEVRMFWGIAIVFGILIFLVIGNAGDALFQVFSALTTTGFTTTAVSSNLFKFLIIMLMLIGGFAGSTAGGIKLIRLGILGKSFSWLQKKISLPQSAVIPFKFHKKVVRGEELTITSLFICLYFVILVVSSLALISLGYSPIDSVFEAGSAQGTVGMSTINEAAMPLIGKIFLIIGMLLGRLEIFPFLALIYALFRARSEWYR